MTSFVLPHEVHGDGAHKVIAVHGWFADRSADALGPADRLGRERFSVVGHSVGPAVARRPPALAPDRLRRLVRVSPVPASGLPLSADRWELFVDAAHRPENRRTVMDFTTPGRMPAASLDRMVARSLELRATKAFRACPDSWTAEDVDTRGGEGEVAWGDEGAGASGDEGAGASQGQGEPA